MAGCAKESAPLNNDETPSGDKATNPSVPDKKNEANQTHVIGKEKAIGEGKEGIGRIFAGQPPSRPQVTLLKAGSKPLQPLRFQLKKGDHSTLELLTDMDMGVSINGAPGPSNKLPVMKALMEIRVIDVIANVFEFEWVINSYTAVPTQGVRPEVMSAMKTQLGNLVGMKGTGKLDNRGFNLGATFSMPPNAAPIVKTMMEGMRDAIAKMAAPLPEQAVGVGGSWKVSQRMTQNGTTHDINTVYTIRAIKGTGANTKVEFDTKVSMTGIPGPVKNGLVPAGVTMHLDSSSGTGVGKATIALGTLTPIHAKTTVSTTSLIVASSGGQKQKIGNQLKLVVTMRTE